MIDELGLEEEIRAALLAREGKRIVQWTEMDRRRAQAALAALARDGKL